MFGARAAVLLLALLAGLTVLRVSAECRMSDSECVFYLEVSHTLTMMHHKDLVYPANGKLYKYDVTNVTGADPISADEVISADGWETGRLVAVVNGTMPGPDIIVYEGQNVIIYLKNNMRSVALTVHWHGLHQRGTPWMDGVPFVTQCPIHPGQTFRYEFLAKPRGTFWYHSHVGAERSMGVFGAFVIREKVETDVEEHVMQIQDWNHDFDSDTGHMKMLLGVYEGRHKWGGAMSLDGSFFSLFRVQSGLINGRGRYRDPVKGNNFAPLTVFNVTRGKRYRFRVIGPGSLYPFRVSVDGHMLTVIASDGYDLEPVVAESFVINPGERFDFEITANQTVGNYWIRGITLEKDTPHIAEAILRYAGAADTDPTTSRKPCAVDSICLVLNCPFLYYPEPYTECRTFDQLKALATDDPAPAYSQDKFKEHFLNFAFPGITSYPGSVNGKTFDTPDVSPLTQPNDWHSPCLESECGEFNHCKCTHALDIGNGDTVQMVFMNMGRGKGWSHPIHMHGHSFYVVKMGYARYNESTGQIIGENLDVDCRGNANREESFCNNATWSNQSWLNGNVPGLELARPPRKDTIIVPTGGYVVLRIRADNPGLWNMHCHIELHNLDGMQMLLNESFRDVPRPPYYFPECHSFSDRRLPEDTTPAPTTTMKISTDPYAVDPKADTEEMFSKTAFWVVFGVLVGVILLQFITLAIVFCCRRSSSANYLTGSSNDAFVAK